MNIFTSLKAFIKRRNERQDPARDWLLLLKLSMVVLVAIVAWNAWTFNRVANGGIIGGLPSGPPPVFSQASLDAINAVFTNRAAEESKYETGVYRYADPSL